ncbi:MAG: DUF3800 domain-containing protein [Verrucomicrobiia bacterium]
MSIDIYADESGIHDREGMEPGSKVAALAGFVAWRGDWLNFCREWQSKLGEYGPPYFHYREIRFRDRDRKSIYHAWPQARVDSFLVELAEIAGRWPRFHIGGLINVRSLHRLASKGDPRRSCPKLFFESFLQEVNDRWPLCTENFTFIFDDTTDKSWKHLIHDTYSDFKAVDRRITEIRFRDKRALEGLPLQAADLLAYRIRRAGVKTMTGGHTKPLPLDDPIDQALFGKAMPSRYNSTVLGLARIRVQAKSLL